MMLSRRLINCSNVNRLCRLISYHSNDDAWKLAITQKQLLGSRTMIITDSDEMSKEYSNRMGYEMQRQGIQPVFCTMNVPYPSHKNIEESVELLKRTGSKSIVSIGSGAVVDTAKAIRLLSETGNRKIFTYNPQKPLQCKEITPLISVATNISHVHELTSFGRLHVEEDVLVKSWCRSPEVTVYDPSVIEKSISFIPEVSTVYVLSQLFDTLFSLSLLLHSHFSNTATTDITNQLLNIIRGLSSVNNIDEPKLHQSYGDKRDPSLLHNLIGKTIGGIVDLSLFSMNEADANSVVPTSRLIALTQSIGKLQSALQSSPSLHWSVWPGLTELSSLLLALNVESELTLPYSWRATESFKVILENLVDPSTIEKRNKNYRRANDKLILNAVDAAFKALTTATGLSFDQILSLNQRSIECILMRMKKFPKKFRQPGSGAKKDSEYQKMTPAGHLEKIIAVAEMDAASSSNSSGGGSVFDEEKKMTDESLRSKLLKSDVMLDLVEKILEK